MSGAHAVCAIWISTFVAKQLASKGFHYKSKSLRVVQLSGLWDVAGCVGGSPPPLGLCMSLAAQTCSFQSIVHERELIIRFLLWFFFSPPLCFCPLWGVRCPALLSVLTALTSLRLSLPLSVALHSQVWWKSMNSAFVEFWWMMAIIHLGGREGLCLL